MTEPTTTLREAVAKVFDATAWRTMRTPERDQRRQDSLIDADIAITTIRDQVIADGGDIEWETWEGEYFAEWITTILTPGAEVQAVPWWMANLPEDVWIEAGPVADDDSPHAGQWYAYAGRCFGYGPTRDEALNAALRDALDQEGNVEP